MSDHTNNGNGRAAVQAALANKAEAVQQAITEVREWGDPIPFGIASEPEPFPSNALPTMLDDCATEIAETVKVDKAAPGVILPGVVSAAAGNAFCVQVSKSYRESNLSRFVVIGQLSGERKSETIRRCAAALDSFSKNDRVAYRQRKAAFDAKQAVYDKQAKDLESKAATAKLDADRDEFLRKAINAREQIPQRLRDPKLYADDMTPEQLAKAMFGAGGGFALLSAEGRKLANIVMGQYRGDGNTSDDLLLKAHGGDMVDRCRVSNGGENVTIVNPSLAIVLALQPDKIRQLVQRQELAESGFLARCNIAAPRSMVGERIESGAELPIRETLVAQMESRLAALIEERFRVTDEDDFRPVQLVLSDAAMVRRRSFANEIELRQAESGDLFRWRSFASKAAGEAARLAALFHLVESPIDRAASQPISVETWNIAERHQRWQLAETIRVVSLSQESAEVGGAKALLNWADRKRLRVITEREVDRAEVLGNVKFESVSALLTKNGFARLLPPQGNQRVQRLELHPLTQSEG